MIEYDPQVIKEYAERLESQSKSIVPIQFFIGMLSGLIIFGGISAIMGVGYDFLIVSIGALVGAVLGHGAGKSRSFELRLQAHLALCQLRIEENTRKK